MAGSIVADMVDSTAVAADMAAWVATVVDIACSAEDVAIAVAVVVAAHEVSVGAIPALDLAGTSLATAPMVEATVVTLVDCS